MALSYDRSDTAPRISAAGRGAAAELILRLAEEAGVPIVEDSALAGALEPFDIGALVPEQYWLAVAHVLAFVADQEEAS